TGLLPGSTTSHGTTPSASTTRPHCGNRIEAMSRSTNPPDSATRLPSKESREFYRPAHGQRINHPGVSPASPVNKQRPQGNPPPRDHRQRQPLLPVHAPH